MKTLLFSLLFVFAGTAAVNAQELKLKTDAAKVEFKVKSEKLTGTMKGFAATIKFDPSNVDNSSMTGTVRVASISTGNSKRDEHLKSSDYFDAKKYPTIKFTSSKIEKSGDYYKMTGKIKIKDVEKTVTFKIKIEEGKIVGSASVYAKDFGMMSDKDKEETKVVIRITIPTA